MFAKRNNIGVFFFHGTKLQIIIDAKLDYLQIVVNAQVVAFVQQRKQDDLNEIIASENLKADETTRFVENAFRDGAIRTTGTDIDKILPAMSRFGGGNR